MDLPFDLLKQGRLGWIRPGVSSQEVREGLGEPEDVSLPGRPLIWKYGALQLFFDADRVTGIWIYLSDDRGLPEALGRPDARLKRTTTREQFEGWLRDRGIGFVIDPELSFEDQLTLRCESGATVCFALDRSELEKIGFP